MDEMTVEEFAENYHCGNKTIDCNVAECSSCIPLLKSDLRKVIEGLLPDKGVYSAKDVIDYIRKRLDEELGGSNG